MTESVRLGRRAGPRARLSRASPPVCQSAWLSLAVSSELTDVIKLYNLDIGEKDVNLIF